MYATIGHFLIGTALLGIIWACLRALGLPRYSEYPTVVLGRTIQLKQLEGLGNDPPDSLEGDIWHFEDDTYRVLFAQPITINGRTTKGATITARHVGYPISRAKRLLFRTRAVCGKMDSGQQFTAMIRLT